MHPATTQADRKIVGAVDTLNRFSTELGTLRAGLAALRLPIGAANDRLDHSDDLLAIVGRQLNDAIAVMSGDFERILREDSDRYDGANDHGAAANDDDRAEIAA